MSEEQEDFRSAELSDLCLEQLQSSEAFQVGIKMFVDLGGGLKLEFKNNLKFCEQGITLHRGSSQLSRMPNNYIVIVSATWLVSPLFEPAYRFFIAHADPKVNPAIGQARAADLLSKELGDNDLVMRFGEAGAIDEIEKVMEKNGWTTKYVMPSQEGLIDPYEKPKGKKDGSEKRPAPQGA